MRAIIERCLGVLKSQFVGLDKTGGTLIYSADKACQLFIAFIATAMKNCPSDDIFFAVKILLAALNVIRKVSSTILEIFEIDWS